MSNQYDEAVYHVRRDYGGRESFGLAQIKTEGMCSSFEHPEIWPWRPYKEEFNEFLAKKYDRWYLRPFYSFLRNFADEVWQAALFENAKGRAMVNKL